MQRRDRPPQRASNAADAQELAPLHGDSAWYQRPALLVPQTLRCTHPALTTRCPPRCRCQRPCEQLAAPARRMVAGRLLAGAQARMARLHRGAAGRLQKRRRIRSTAQTQHPGTQRPAGDQLPAALCAASERQVAQAAAGACVPMRHIIVKGRPHNARMLCQNQMLGML
jgi:hypothetical protein